MNKIGFFIFILLFFKINNSNILTVYIELTQFNSNIKVRLNQTSNISSSYGIISLPYSYEYNNIIINRTLNLGSLTLTNEVISLIIPFFIYDTTLTFENTTINVGNDNWNLQYSNNKIIINTPLIKVNNSYTNNNFSIILELYCENCDENNAITKGKKIPDYTFFITDKENLNISYLISCSYLPNINSNSSFNISCIPFSTGDITYYNVKSNYLKNGFLIINETNNSLSSSYKSNRDNCESLLNGDSIFFDSNDKEKNYSFILNSPFNITEDNFPILYSNSTNITNECFINNINEKEIICNVDSNKYIYFKNKDENIYYIYEKKFCGDAFTGIMVYVENGNFIKNGFLFLILILIF